MKGNERLNLINMLDDMNEHFRNNMSYISRIYGVYTIKTNSFASVDILVMQNTMKDLDKNNRSIVFDLKGSLYKRY